MVNKYAPSPSEIRELTTVLSIAERAAEFTQIQRREHERHVDGIAADSKLIVHHVKSLLEAAAAGEEAPNPPDYIKGVIHRAGEGLLAEIDELFQEMCKSRDELVALRKNLVVSGYEDL